MQPRTIIRTPLTNQHYGLINNFKVWFIQTNTQSHLGLWTIHGLITRFSDFEFL